MSIKYTRKMPKRLNQIYIALQIAVFLPLFIGINTEDALLQAILWPLLIFIVLIGMVYRFLSYCQLRDDGLYIAPSKELLPYNDIVGLVPHDRAGLEIDYILNGQSHSKILYFTMRDSFLLELQLKMKG